MLQEGSWIYESGVQWQGLDWSNLGVICVRYEADELTKEVNIEEKSSKERSTTGKQILAQGGCGG